MIRFVKSPGDGVRLATENDLHELNVIYNHYVRTSHVTFDVAPVSMK